MAETMFDKGELERSYKKYLALMSDVERYDSNTTKPRIIQENNSQRNAWISHQKFLGIDPRDNKNSYWNYLLIFVLIASISAAVTASTFSSGTYCQRFTSSLTLPEAQKQTIMSDTQNPLIQHVLLNVPGSVATTSSNSECGKYVKKFVKGKYNKFEKKKRNVALVDSLCDYLDITKKHFIKSNVMLSIVIHNPIQRAIQSFVDGQDTDSIFYSEDFTGLSFEEFSNSSLIGNDYLTRALICKHDTKTLLTKEDLKLAIQILKSSTILSTHNLEDPIQAFLSHLPDYADNCMPSVSHADRRLDNENQRKLKKRAYVPKLVNKHYKHLKEKNEFDLRLYSYFLKELRDDHVQ